ncbi:MAG TPA: hypothetical protein VFC13_25095 [Actinomycetes bacterium]|nr:hypothetical protein [Actinomycetes bacterium]
MRPNRLLVPALVRGGLALAAGLALVLGGTVQPAAATTIGLVSVPLGTHRFGHLRAPDEIVAHADPNQVGFYQPPKGMDGVAFGPWSFDVARDGSIWLLDEVNHRLLSWQPGRPAGPSRSVKLPADPLERVADFAVAPNHTIYATYVPPPGPGPKTLRLAALGPGGRVRWTAPTTVEIFNAQLRIGPDNALYVYGGQPGYRWTPLTTPAGLPLSVADQRRRTSPQQPLVGGLRLAGSHPAPGERRVILSDEAGRVVRGWRVTSRTQLGAEGATPALVGGDPVVVFDVSKETSGEFRYEYEVLRLARTGGTSQRFAIAPATSVVWGDAPITGVRVGPDGRLYQLRTSRTRGVDIARYSLAPDQQAPPTTPTTAPVPEPPAPKGPPVDNGGGVTAPTVSTPPAQPVARPVEPAAGCSRGWPA